MCGYKVDGKPCGNPAVVGVCPTCHTNICENHSHYVGAELYCIKHGPDVKYEGIE